MTQLARIISQAQAAGIDPAAECTDLDQLRAMWSSASTVQQEQINARAAELAQEVQE